MKHQHREWHQIRRDSKIVARQALIELANTGKEDNWTTKEKLEAFCAAGVGKVGYFWEGAKASVAKSPAC